MTTLTPDAISVASPRATRTAGLVVVVLALVGASALSLAVGAKSIPLGTVLDALLDPSDTRDSVIITDLRVPRTILGILVGASLGLAGALMQALTRNPLADPGLGAGLLLASDIAGQQFLGDTELPVGNVTGLTGGAYLAWLLATERTRGRS